MRIGPDLAGLKAAAESALGRAQPPILPGYPHKAAEARIVAAGGASAVIAAEAELRGVTPAALAASVLAAADSAHAAEIARVEAVLAVRGATDEAGVWAVLTAAGITQL